MWNKSRLSELLCIIAWSVSLNSLPWTVKYPVVSVKVDSNSRFNQVILEIYIICCSFHSACFKFYLLFNAWILVKKLWILFNLLILMLFDLICCKKHQRRIFKSKKFPSQFWCRNFSKDLTKMCWLQQIWLFCLTL